MAKVQILSGESFKKWQVVHHIIPSDAFSELGLTTWTIPELETATKLVQAIVILSQSTLHIRDFRDIPDLDTYGKEQLQDYINHLSKTMSEVFQLFMDSASEMLETFNNLPDSEREHRPNLVAVVQALLEMRKSIFPTSNFEGEALLGLEDLFEWADRLEKGQEYASLAYLHWATDVLDHNVASPRV